MIAGHGNFGEQWKLSLVLHSGEFLDGVVAVGLLLPEIVGGKGQHHQALIAVFLVQRLQPFVLPAKTLWLATLTISNTLPR